MKKLIKSMMYRLVRDIFFYIALIITLMAAVIFSMGATLLENHVLTEDGSATISFEDEDPRNVAEHIIFMGDSYFHNIPGKDLIYGKASLDNMTATEDLVSSVVEVALIMSILYAMLFFDGLFSKSAIRNMVVAGSGKSKIFLASLLFNLIVLLILTIAPLPVMAIIMLVKGFYPIIYLPSLLCYIVTDLMIATLLTTIVTLIIFITQKPIKALIVTILLFIAYSVSINSIPYWMAYQTRYKVDSDAFTKFYKYERSTPDTAWYVPVSGFNNYSVYTYDGELYTDFLTDEPDPEYPGDTKVAVMKALYRANVFLFPMDTYSYRAYPMMRDGVFLRYILVSAGYIIALTAAGCAIIKKRNIN